jgi:prolycopene isomerase
MLTGRIMDPKLKGILSAQWAYYGLPPSRLSCFYYALPLLGYLAHGGWYPKGRSQDISNAFVRYIEAHGGKVLLNTRVRGILLDGDAAGGVTTAGGKTFTSRVVVSNANPFATFGKMIDRPDLVVAYEKKWTQYSVSLSCFQIFLGLNKDLVKKTGVTDSELFIQQSYDPEEDYAAALRGDVETGGYCVSLYDNINPSYSPAGKNTVNILALQGYQPWERFETEYSAGEKGAYTKEKQRLADILIRRAEKDLLPGLSGAIEVREVGTPLTNVRYTGTHRGAIYGWDQTVNNSGSIRVGHTTPVKNLYLAGAWSEPGHGYGAVIPSGLNCFAEIMKSW